MTPEGYIPRSWAVYFKSHGVLPKEDEVIVHKNGDTADDSIDNLELMTKSDYGRRHFEIHEIQEKTVPSKAGKKGGNTVKELYGNEYFRIIPFLSGMSYKELYGITDEDKK